MKRGREKKKGKSDKSLSFIKDCGVKKSLDNQSILNEDYPIFCFKHLSERSIKGCKDYKFFYKFLMRLQVLSNAGWSQIRDSAKHSYGISKIPVGKIKPDKPECVTPEIKDLHVFRAKGNNLPFVGLQVDKIFRVFFIETNFGDIYDH